MPNHLGTPLCRKILPGNAQLDITEWHKQPIGFTFESVWCVCARLVPSHADYGPGSQWVDREQFRITQILFWNEHHIIDERPSSRLNEGNAWHEWMSPNLSHVTCGWKVKNKQKIHTSMSNWNQMYNVNQRKNYHTRSFFCTRQLCSGR